jgi:hypothetical protein
MFAIPFPQLLNTGTDTIHHYPRSNLFIISLETLPLSSRRSFTFPSLQLVLQSQIPTAPTDRSLLSPKDYVPPVFSSPSLNTWVGQQFGQCATQQRTQRSSALTTRYRLQTAVCIFELSDAVQSLSARQHCVLLRPVFIQEAKLASLASIIYGKHKSRNQDSLIQFIVVVISDHSE